jgi:dTDP-glucose 4,6-dehydratase
MCILDVSKAERDLGWVPQYRDEDMLIAAYKEYRAKKGSPAVAPASIAAE